MALASNTATQQQSTACLPQQQALNSNELLMAAKLARLSGLCYRPTEHLLHSLRAEGFSLVAEGCNSFTRYVKSIVLQRKIHAGYEGGPLMARTTFLKRGVGLAARHQQELPAAAGGILQRAGCTWGQQNPSCRPASSRVLPSSSNQLRELLRHTLPKAVPKLKAPACQPGQTPQRGQHRVRLQLPWSCSIRAQCCLWEASAHSKQWAPPSGAPLTHAVLPQGTCTPVEAPQQARILAGPPLGSCLLKRLLPHGLTLSACPGLMSCMPVWTQTIAS